MKTVRLIVGVMALMVFCACGSARHDYKKTSEVDAAKSKGTVFYDLTLEEALEKAKVEGKLVMIDFYTKTCGPCRMMERDVFSTPECGEYINKRFVPIMIDGEDDGVGTEIAKKHQVFIFPTYMIMSPDGFKEGEVLGAEYDVNKFLDMLKTIVHDN